MSLILYAKMTAGFLQPLQAKARKTHREDRFLIKLLPKSAAIVALIMTNGVNAFAQERDQQHINVGEARLFPSLTFEYLNNDNVFRDPAPISTSGVVVSPKALFIADRRGLALRLGYEGSYGAFDEDSINFVDHRIFGSADAVFGVRKRGRLDVSIDNGHQALGAGLTRHNASIGDESVEFIDSSIRGGYIYGAPTARFNISGGLRLFSRSYQNRLDVSDGRSYTEFTPFGQVSYRLSSDTRALLQLRYGSFSFEDSSRDREELQVLTGLAFSGGGKLSGELKFGIAQPDYANPNTQDNSILTVDTTLTYEPSSLSTFDLRFVRQLDNGGSLNQLINESQIVDDTLALSWKKVWSGFVSSNALISAALEDGGCPVDSSATVKTEFDIGLKVRRWLTFGLGLSNTSYTESQCDSAIESENDYDLVELKAFVTLSL